MNRRTFFKVLPASLLLAKTVVLAKTDATLVLASNKGRRKHPVFKDYQHNTTYYRGFTIIERQAYFDVKKGKKTLYVGLQFTEDPPSWPQFQFESEDEALFAIDRYYRFGAYNPNNH